MSEPVDFDKLVDTLDSMRADNAPREAVRHFLRAAFHVMREESLRLLPTGAAGERVIQARSMNLDPATIRATARQVEREWAESDSDDPYVLYDALVQAGAKAQRAPTTAREPVAEVSKGDLLIPVAPTRDDDTVAQGILRHVAHMRRHDQLDQSLCWDPQELELLAMFAIDAKNKLKRVDEAAALTHPSTSEAVAFVDVVCDGPPGPSAGRFVECEDASGKSVRAGEWHERPDGLWALRIYTHPPTPEAGTVTCTACNERRVLTSLCQNVSCPAHAPAPVAEGVTEPLYLRLGSLYNELANECDETVPPEVSQHLVGAVTLLKLACDEAARRGA